MTRHWLVLGTCVSLLPGLARAQAHDYRSIVEQGIESLGGPEGLAQARWSEVRGFVGALVLRGEFYYDLYRFQSALQRDYARLRSSDEVEVRVPEARYFEGRALMEMGDLAGARRAFSSLEAETAVEVRSLAELWSNAINDRAGWPGVYVAWAASPGSPPQAVACPSSSIRCELFAAVAAGDRVQIAVLSRRLLTSGPVFSQQGRVRGVDDVIVDVDVHFHDAFDLRLLSLADFALALSLLDGVEVSGSQALGDFTRARIRDEAPQGPAVGSRELVGAYEVRALLASGNAQRALERADAAMRPVFGKGLDEVPPSLSLVHAHAAYAVGRLSIAGADEGGVQRFKEARSALDRLVGHFPALGPARRMLQELTDPNRVVGRVRTGY